MSVFRFLILGERGFMLSNIFAIDDDIRNHIEYYVFHHWLCENNINTLDLISFDIFIR